MVLLVVCGLPWKLMVRFGMLVVFLQIEILLCSIGIWCFSGEFLWFVVLFARGLYGVRL